MVINVLLLYDFFIKSFKLKKNKFPDKTIK